jgi:hypothetical protein
MLHVACRMLRAPVDPHAVARAQRRASRAAPCLARCSVPRALLRAVLKSAWAASDRLFCIDNNPRERFRMARSVCDSLFRSACCTLRLTRARAYSCNSGKLPSETSVGNFPTRFLAQLRHDAVRHGCARDLLGELRRKVYSRSAANRRRRASPRDSTPMRSDAVASPFLTASLCAGAGNERAGVFVRAPTRA